jgi:hypothetical protein
MDAGPLAFLDERIAMADAAGLHFEAHLAGARLGNITFNQFKRFSRTANLGSTHFWHKKLLFNFVKTNGANLSLFGELTMETMKRFSGAEDGLRFTGKTYGQETPPV